MRRAQAIIVLIAMLASPLALFARSEACADACTKSCCIALHHSTRTSTQKAGHCHGANHTPAARCCDEPTSNHALDYGFTVLMPFSILPNVASIAPPSISRTTLPSDTLFAPLAFTFIPFEPPRA